MSPSASALISGFLTCATLIVAIGAQNVFVLRQGLLRRHVGPVVLVCGITDTLLVWAGVAGGGSLLGRVPGLATTLALAGAAFLLRYGLSALRRALRETPLAVAPGEARGLAPTMVATAAFTFLNPHVYLDTVLLMGAAGSSLPEETQPFFVLGASVASFGWFTSIGFGARVLAPLFARPATWRVLDAGVGCTMLILALGLVAHALPGR